KLFQQAASPYIEIHQKDAERLGIQNHDCVEVKSKRATIQIEAHITERIREGLVFMPFHWGDFFAYGQAANNLTHDALDPISKEPEYKACAVNIKRVSE